MQLLTSKPFKEKMRNTRGFTLIELIVATTILLILTGMAIPMARVTIKREKERELRHDLWEMRDAIDRYKEAADREAAYLSCAARNSEKAHTQRESVERGGKGSTWSGNGTMIFPLPAIHSLLRFRNKPS